MNEVSDECGMVVEAGRGAIDDSIDIDCKLNRWLPGVGGFCGKLDLNCYTK